VAFIFLGPRIAWLRTNHRAYRQLSYELGRLFVEFSHVKDLCCPFPRVCWLFINRKPADRRLTPPYGRIQIGTDRTVLPSVDAWAVGELGFARSLSRSSSQSSARACINCRNDCSSATDSRIVWRFSVIDVQFVSDLYGHLVLSSLARLNR